MKSLLAWIREHRVASLVILILLVIGVSSIWWVRPAYFGLTHANMQDCGSVSRSPGPRLQTEGKSSPEQIIQCFVQAHQQCRAASIASTSFDLDAGFTETFYTANALGQCSLSVQTVNYVVSLTRVTNDDTCSSIVQKADGVHFICSSSGEQVFPVK